ncbi:MAG: TauD/TfdA family dioxygenase [Bordetella sp.]
MDAFKTILVKPIHPRFGAEILGVNLTRPTQAQIFEIQEAWAAYSVLLFRNQSLGPGDLVEFSKHFGELDPPPVNEDGKTFVEDFPDIYVVSNVLGEDGKPIGSLGAGEATWHTDMSYLQEPPDASMLYSIEIPKQGGDTWFCSMEGALQDMPEALLSQLRSLRIKHDGTYNSGGYLRQGLKDSNDPVNSVGTPHPAICAHPVTGRPYLYLGRRRNAYVLDHALEDSEKLLDALWAYPVQAHNVYRHQWQLGDLVMWDNRTTMHRRDSFDTSARRIMHRTQIKGSHQPRAFYSEPVLAAV